MKKSIIATTVAAALSLSANAYSAELLNKDGTILNVYGNLQFAYWNVQAADGDNGSDSRGQFGDNGSTIGFSGEHSLNDSLTAYFKYEFESDADEIKTGNGIDTGDQAYFGIKGRYGDGRVGSWDALIDDWIQDPASNYEFFDVSDSNSAIQGTNGFNTQGTTSTDREGDKFQYLSPDYKGLRLAAGFQLKGNDEDENIGNSDKAAFFGGAEYTLGAVKIAFVYDSLDNYDGDVTGRQFLDVNGNVAGSFDAGDQFGLTMQYKPTDDLRLAFKIEQYNSGDTNFVADEARYALSARYHYGPGDVYGTYQFVDVDNTQFSSAAGVSNNDDETFNEVVLGTTYDLTPSLYTFVEAAYFDREDDLGDGVAVGAAYLF
ncbi:porin [Granulosicoccus antarcticus]|uniref:Monosaccharide porin n=1 Tax=Granulosicoccus antarcticus IMCC3135 TaxID=1192854 RepID=A0A2Z2NI42_9GAMM|nr:porin [Granulosicoccus antarcticus]ASJ70819.1 Monosaccharide porin [Granulosicoccus antarcticus IMCC3135]